jgi:hypothetical protein
MRKISRYRSFFARARSSVSWNICLLYRYEENLLGGTQRVLIQLHADINKPIETSETLLFMSYWPVIDWVEAGAAWLHFGTHFIKNLLFLNEQKAPVPPFTWSFGHRNVVKSVRNINDATAASAPVNLTNSSGIRLAPILLTPTWFVCSLTSVVQGL